MQRIRTMGALAVAIIAGACDKGTGPSNSLDTDLDADVAVVAANSVAEDADAMRNPGMPTTSAAAVSGDFQLGVCTFSAVAGRFTCPVKTFGGLTFTRSYAFFAVGGAPMSLFDALLTASANLQSGVSGEVNRGHWRATIEWNRDFTVSGLAGEETSWTWNGTGSGSIEGSRHKHGDTERTYNLSTNTTVTNVVVPRSEGAYPTSGTVTVAVELSVVGGERDGENFTRTVTVTFDGTQSARVLVGGAKFKVNLATRAVVKED
ncbi:MAG: hypothetical protein HOP28_04235 [Gemmatimonadales bacterium]|nr:hypothetical protein [Gemmatimonadales bacterium]